MIAVPLATFCIVLLMLVVVLLCVSVGRLLRTPKSHPDRAARRDTVRLLFVLCGALGLAALRTQYLSSSRPFLILTVGLVPLGMVACWLMVRLIGAYRHQNAAPLDQTLPDLESVQSRISPLSMERNNDDSRRNTRS